MTNENKVQQFFSNAKKDESWLKKAQWRKENRHWLDRSFDIAVEVLAAIKSRKMTQVELAEKLGVSAQYVNKLLKGQENLTLDTIGKLEKVLSISLIEIKTSSAIEETPVLAEKKKQNQPVEKTITLKVKLEPIKKKEGLANKVYLSKVNHKYVKAYELPEVESDYSMVAEPLAKYGYGREG
jgi:transcriptional regulator with XRE-family HTH domain